MNNNELNNLRNIANQMGLDGNYQIVIKKNIDGKIIKEIKAFNLPLERAEKWVGFYKNAEIEWMEGRIVEGIDLSKPVKFKEAIDHPDEINLIFRVTNYNDKYNRVYIELLNSGMAFPPQQLVSIFDIENIKGKE